MSTKKTPGAFDCYANALPDEPMFVLLARDPSAPRLVRQWALSRRFEIAAETRPETDLAMVDEAIRCAEDMERWRAENDGAWRKEPPL